MNPESTPERVILRMSRAGSGRGRQMSDNLAPPIGVIESRSALGIGTLTAKRRTGGAARLPDRGGE
jgi:hypothetical protein